MKPGSVALCCLGSFVAGCVCSALVLSPTESAAPAHNAGGSSADARGFTAAPDPESHAPINLTLNVPGFVVGQGTRGVDLAGPEAVYGFVALTVEDEHIQVLVIAITDSDVLSVNTYGAGLFARFFIIPKDTVALLVECDREWRLDVYDMDKMMSLSPDDPAERARIRASLEAR